MGLLWPLMGTPRAAKRLANTYRLIRASLDGPSLAAFVRANGSTGEYQAVLILLAILIGFPGLAGRAFRAALERPDGAWWRFVEDLAPESAANESATDEECQQWDRVRRGMRVIQPGCSIPDSMDLYRRWIPRVARYSFETELVENIGDGDISP